MFVFSVPAGRVADNPAVHGASLCLKQRVTIEIRLVKAKQRGKALT
jgi:hypothetical protein